MLEYISLLLSGLSFLTVLYIAVQLKNAVDNKTDVISAVNQSIQNSDNNHFNHLTALNNNLLEFTKLNEAKLEGIRNTVEDRLFKIQSDNNQRLEQMRATVEEKLHHTLEKRLGDSFKIVSDRLEMVYKGLGEMQSLAHGVGDLKKVLTNVKTRGVWGEVQLESLIEQIMAPEQYIKNATIKEGSQERVEFAIKIPAKDAQNSHILLPIDAKFPMEVYQRIITLSEEGNLEGLNNERKALEAAIKFEAKRIKEKYISPPMSTDFAIMFLPIEGLYAEVIRTPGLLEFLQREHRVVITSPTTLMAILNSLQIGFKALAIERRSSDVWKILGSVKSEFAKFADILAKTKLKLDQASKVIGDAETRTRVIQRQLRNVENIEISDSLNDNISAELDKPVNFE